MNYEKCSVLMDLWAVMMTSQQVAVLLFRSAASRSVPESLQLCFYKRKRPQKVNSPLMHCLCLTPAPKVMEILRKCHGN